MNSIKNIFENDIVYTLPEIYMFLVIMVLLVVGVVYNKKVVSLGKRLTEVIMSLGCLGVFYTLILHLNQGSEEVNLWSDQVVKGASSLYIGGLVLTGLLLYMLMTYGYLRKDTIDDFEYVILILLSSLGLMVLVSANDLLVLYLGIELQSLGLYILATFKQNSNYSTEAGLKYFVLGAISSGIILFGIGLFYGFTGITNFTDMAYYFMVVENISLGVIVSLVCLLIGLLFKIGAVPFHMWLPDVYEGAPTLVTAFFAIVPKIAIVGLMVKIYYGVFYGMSNEWSNIYKYAAILSLLVGSLGALYQRTFKRLVAYSAIGHTGFILLGFVAGSLEGVEGVYIYLMIYMLLVVNMFSIILSLRKQTDYKLLKLLGNGNQLYNNNKALIISMCLLLFSIAGIPPLAGFYSKLYIFFSTMKEGYVILSVIAILISVVGSVYYIRLIRIMFFSNDRRWGFFFPVEKEVAYVIALSSFFGLMFSTYGYPLIMMIHRVVLGFYI